jgi:hypothetical protein
MQSTANQLYVSFASLLAKQIFATGSASVVKLTFLRFICDYAAYSEAWVLGGKRLSI